MKTYMINFEQINILNLQNSLLNYKSVQCCLRIWSNRVLLRLYRFGQCGQRNCGSIPHSSFTWRFKCVFLLYLFPHLWHEYFLLAYDSSSEILFFRAGLFLATFLSVWTVSYKADADSSYDGELQHKPERKQENDIDQ